MRPKFEIAHIVEQFSDDAFRQSIPVYKKRALNAIVQCRTAVLGGHVDACDNCGVIKISYNSCRNRNCPKCQGIQKEAWVIQREEELLPVSYFHVVFTLPHELNSLCLVNPRFMYQLLFHSAWHVLSSFANDPKWLSAQSAATMVLHTWGQNLQLHPHVHCIVPNGGIDQNGNWKNPKRGNSRFLYPVNAMKKVFRAYFMKQLHLAINSGTLVLPNQFPHGNQYFDWKNKLFQKDWVVYTKKPFSKPHNVVNYLARYSHKIAITNHRLLNVTDKHVTFKYKDYKDNGRSKTMVLQGTDFLQRYCLHILPNRFRKIRHYGFLANGNKRKRLTDAKKDLENKSYNPLTKKEREAFAKLRLFGIPSQKCACCKVGNMVTIEVWQPINSFSLGARAPPKKPRFQNPVNF